MTKLTTRILIVGEGTIGRALYEAPLAAAPIGERILVPARRLEQHADTIRNFARDRDLKLIFAHGAPVQGLQIGGRYFSRRTYASLVASRTDPMECMASILRDHPHDCQAALVSSTVIDAVPHRSRSLASMQAACEASFSALFAGRGMTVVRVGTLLGEGAQFPQFVAHLARTRLIKRMRARPDFRVRTCTMATLVRTMEGALTPQASGVTYAVDDTLSLNSYLDTKLGAAGEVALPRSLFLAIFGLLGVPAEFFTCDRPSGT